MKARIREEVILTMSVTEARRLQKDAQHIASGSQEGFEAFNPLAITLDSVIGGEIQEAPARDALTP